MIMEVPNKADKKSQLDSDTLRDETLKYHASDKTILGILSKCGILHCKLDESKKDDMKTCKWTFHM